MAVETRVIIDANAQNAIREIGKLDDAAADADKTIGKLDDQTVNVNTSPATDGMDELRRMGDEAIASFKELSAQSITIDVDTSELDKLDGAATGAKTKIDDFSKSADSSKSVLANMVGNTTQDLGALGGVAGSAGVAIGQMAEYMADAAGSGDKLGAILKNFAGVAVPILAISVGMKEFADTQARAAKVKAFRKQEVEDYTDALKEADSTLGAIQAKLEADQGIFVNFFGSEEDVSGVFTALGTGADQVAQLIAGGTASIDAWGAALRAGGADADAVTIATGVLKANVEDLTAAQDNAATVAQFFATETEHGTVAFHAARDAVVDLADGFDTTTIAIKRVEEANRKLRGDLDQREAYLNLLDSFDDLKVKSAEAFFAAAGGASDATAKARDYEQAQIDVKNQVIDYTEQIGKVPTDITTDLVTKVDSGQLDTLTHDLDILTMGVKTVDVRVRTTVDQAWNQVVNNIVPGRLNGKRPP